MKNNYSINVFLNCPFDNEHLKIRNAILFTIYDCGFVPRCSLEESDSTTVRFDKIKRLIHDSKFGIHDISKTELDNKTKLPRFNMPLELGIFLGMAHAGNTKQNKKNCLILDKTPYRYQKFISDISGQDIEAHNNKPSKAIILVRNWLRTSVKTNLIPGGKEIQKRFRSFNKDLPEICATAKISPSDLIYNDYSLFISNWCKANPLETQS